MFWACVHFFTILNTIKFIECKHVYLGYGNSRLDTFVFTNNGDQELGHVVTGSYQDGQIITVSLLCYIRMYLNKPNWCLNIEE